MIQSWFCDDGQVIASPLVIAEVFEFLVAELKSICLETNFKKTELIALDKSIISIDQVIDNDENLDILNTPCFILGEIFILLVRLLEIRVIVINILHLSYPKLMFYSTKS